MKTNPVIKNIISSRCRGSHKLFQIGHCIGRLHARTVLNVSIKSYLCCIHIHSQTLFRGELAKSTRLMWKRLRASLYFLLLLLLPPFHASPMLVVDGTRKDCKPVWGQETTETCSPDTATKPSCFNV